VPFSPADQGPEDVDPINAAVQALLNALPRQVAELTLRLADETDGRVATLDPQQLWPEDPPAPSIPCPRGPPGRAPGPHRGRLG
jgi:hypothetical protein